jgi:hypothetical protein
MTAAQFCDAGEHFPSAKVQCRADVHVDAEGDVIDVHHWTAATHDLTGIEDS